MEAEVKANVGFLQATVRAGEMADPEDSGARVSVLISYLEKHDKVGTVSQPQRYIKDTAALKYGVVSEYASDIAFFGGSVGSTDIGLIGSSESVVGEVQRSESGHSPFYYTLKFLNRMAGSEHPSGNPDYYSYREAFDIASAAAPIEAEAAFFAETLHQGAGSSYRYSAIRRNYRIEHDLRPQISLLGWERTHRRGLVAWDGPCRPVTGVLAESP